MQRPVITTCSCRGRCCRCSSEVTQCCFNEGGGNERQKQLLFLVLPREEPEESEAVRASEWEMDNVERPLGLTESTTHNNPIIWALPGVHTDMEACEQYHMHSHTWAHNVCRHTHTATLLSGNGLRQCLLVFLMRREENTSTPPPPFYKLVFQLQNVWGEFSQRSEECQAAKLFTFRPGAVFVDIRGKFWDDFAQVSS